MTPPFTRDLAHGRRLNSQTPAWRVYAKNMVLSCHGTSSLRSSFPTRSAVCRRRDGGHRLAERGVSPRVPESRPPGVCRAVHRHGGFRVAGVQHGSGPRRAGGDGAEQLGVPERYGPPSDRLESTRRAGPCDGVRRLPAILARLERRAHVGVRQVRRLPAPAAGWQLANGPLLRLRGLDSAAFWGAPPLSPGPLPHDGSRRRTFVPSDLER